MIHMDEGHPYSPLLNPLMGEPGLSTEEKSLKL